MENYVSKYHPKIIIIMAGYNNEWSLAESNIARFVKGKDSFKIRLLVELDQSRIFRVIRYAYLRLTVDKKSDYYTELNTEKYVWGGTELVRWPPSEEVYAFAEQYQPEFVELWNYDMHNIISIAKKHNVTVILMTYHINPTYLSTDTFEKMAKQEGVILVRNDLVFNQIIRHGTINEYVFPQDHWHPNGKGYQLIANNVYKTIVQNNLLENKTT
jgi:lysophospholipase L1-like esterase